MAGFKASAQALARRILDPLAGLILRMGFSPDALTLTGLLLSLLAGYSASRGNLGTAGTLLFFGGLCDVLDGSMARRGGRTSMRGAFLDSTLDRLGEIGLFLGLVLFFRENTLMLFVTVLALTGSLMTSYARARAEGLGVDCKVGLLERPERVVLLILGLWLAQVRVAGIGLLELVIGALAVLTYLTTIQRILHVVGHTAIPGEGDGKAPGADDEQAVPPADEDETPRESIRH